MVSAGDVRIIVYHSDIPVTDAELAMDSAHGWDDIGYHYLVDWQGRILERRPLGLEGAHTESNNPGSSRRPVIFPPSPRLSRRGPATGRGTCGTTSGSHTRSSSRALRPRA
jgi:hypothetical protein